MEFQEFTGDNVDLAINEACTRLQVPSDELEYEIISRESAGFLGFGKKPARIRARKKETVNVVLTEKKPVKEQTFKAPKQEVKEEKPVQAAAPETKEETAKPEFKKEFKNKNGKKKNFDKKKRGFE